MDRFFIFLSNFSRDINAAKIALPLVVGQIAGFLSFELIDFSLGILVKMFSIISLALASLYSWKKYKEEK